MMREIRSSGRHQRTVLNECFPSENEWKSCLCDGIDRKTNRTTSYILDPNASIGALRHEFEHFLDVSADGFPGLGHYYQDLPRFAKIEVRGYLREIHTARETGHADLVPQIVAQLRRRVKEVLGR